MDNYFYKMLPPEEMEQLSYIPTVPEFVEWFTRKWAELPAVSDTVNTYTYAQMGERIARRRAYLNALGLAQGDRLAIWERTSIDAVEMFLAATSAGYVGILLPTGLPAPAIVGCCKRFGVSALAVRDEFSPALPEQMPCRVISSSAMADEGAPVAVVDKEQPAAIFFTGGTTGAPKGAVLAHRALMRGAFNGCFAPGSQLANQRLICFLPLSHVFGLIHSTLGAFYVGATWFSAEDAKATMGKLPAIKPTMLVLVPGLCEILAGLAKMYGPQFFGGELKTIISGAANVPPRLMKVFEAMGVRLLAGYGMTETANLTTGNADTDTHPDSVGKVYPEQEIKFVDDEIWIRGDNVFSGYYGDPEETAKTLTPDGWVRSGDLGRMDEDGFVYITGRIKNLIILPNGENLSPEEIEGPFYKSPTVRDCLVSESEIDGEPVLAIEILPNMPAFEGKSWDEVTAHFEQLVKDINATLPSTHRIRKVSVRKEDFKRSGAMKVLRNQN